MNTVDYNPLLDQVLVASPTFSEVWIIDHTTTTQEAASHSGGFSGRGGDLMYRWGNPQVYRHGTSADQKLFFAHGAHWIDNVDPSNPLYGKIAVFNNRIRADSSSVNIFNPLFLDYAWMYAMDNDSTFLPKDFDWSYSHPDKSKMYSDGLSSVEPLPNGNTLILSGAHGYAFEINPAEQIIWEYVLPLRQGIPVAQGETLSNRENLMFRFERYPADDPAFAGRDLSPKGYIELNPDTSFCTLTSSVAGVGNGLDFQLIQIRYKTGSRSPGMLPGMFISCCTISLATRFGVKLHQGAITSWMLVHWLREYIY